MGEEGDGRCARQLADCWRGSRRDYWLSVTGVTSQPGIGVK